MAVYVIHASLLLIFAGGIIDGFFGFSGFIPLHKGQTGNVIELRAGGNKTLPFSVKCYSAGQENYADGSPKKWWSKLAVVDNGKEVASKEIVVNDPLVYHGLRFFQASYWIDSKKVDGLRLSAVNAGRRGATARIGHESAGRTRSQHHRHADRLHLRRFRSRRPGLQEVRRDREHRFRS